MPPLPQFADGWQLGTPDLVLESDSSFTLPASGPDVYWNFILNPNLTARRWVRAIEIRPGQRRLVHHANLLVDRMGTARAQETAPGKGFPGMDLVLLRSPAMVAHALLRRTLACATNFSVRNPDSCRATNSGVPG